MSQIAIRVENLGKQYRIGVRSESYRTMRDTLAETVRRPVRALSALFHRNGTRSAEVESDIWALRQVSFQVSRGEVVGIIGRNGAGKTTLLKVLSRITEPSEGCGEIHGRVGSLLEVGTGFHPELTGRENIYLNGAILGMRRAEIQTRFDQIVTFAEVERFLDTPVKHYSSGMYLRLAFAVAAHLDPEVLLVDEVLAVGDASFQKKCLGRMGEVAKEGRTVVFVSHNMAAVKGLCERAIWLDSGTVSADNRDVEAVISKYLLSGTKICQERLWPELEAAPGNEKIRIRCARIQSVNGPETEVLRVSTPFEVAIEYWNLKPSTRLLVSLFLLNEEGGCVFNTTTSRESNWYGRPHPEGLFRSVCHIPANLLNSGVHSIFIKFAQDSKVILYQQADLLTFEVHDIADDRGDWYGKWPGAVRPCLEWRTEQLEHHG